MIFQMTNFESNMYSFVIASKPYHIDVEAGLSLMKSTISKTGMGVTSRP